MNIIGEIDYWTVINLDERGRYWAVLRDAAGTIHTDAWQAMAFTEDAVRAAVRIQLAQSDQYLKSCDD